MIKKFFTILMVAVLLAPAVTVAKEISVNTKNFQENWDNANNGDVLLLDEGDYSATFILQPNKTITLKGMQGKNVVLQKGPSIGEQSENVGLILEDLTVKLRSGDHFMRFGATSVSTFEFRNCTIDAIPRCFYNATCNTIVNNILFENCVIKNCGTKGWCFIWSKASIKKLTVRNCTLYNYIDGESFFFQSDRRNGNVIEVLFENNTVSKWGLGDAETYPFINITNKYSGDSSYTFRNNIFSESSIKANLPFLINMANGTLIAEKNLIMGFGEYNVTGTAKKTVNDITLGDLGLQEIGFVNPMGGDFTLPSKSPLLKAGVGKKVIGDVRWAK